MSTALTVVGRNDLEANADHGADIAAIERAESELARLVDVGDITTLHEVAVAADARRLYERRNRHAEMADRYGRLKVLAEAGIGAVDLVAVPELADSRRGGENPPLVVSDGAVRVELRRHWRRFAWAHERGLLTIALEQLAADPYRSITTDTTRMHLGHMGAHHVPAEALRGPVNKFREADGLSHRQMAELMGNSRSSTSLSRWFPDNGRKPIAYRLHWRTAKRLAETVGVDPLSLPPAPQTKAEIGRYLAKRKATYERARRAQAALSRQEREKAIKQAVKKAGAATAEACLIIGRLDGILGQARQEATTKEARLAINEVHALRDKMMDVILPALGIS